jgi:hypothetical protein
MVFHGLPPPARPFTPPDGGGASFGGPAPRQRCFGQAARCRLMFSIWIVHPFEFISNALARRGRGILSKPDSTTQRSACCPARSGHATLRFPSAWADAPHVFDRIAARRVVGGDAVMR